VLSFFSFFLTEYFCIKGKVYGLCRHMTVKVVGHMTVLLDCHMTVKPLYMRRLILLNRCLENDAVSDRVENII